jgi:branched-chain amino acid transport system permease protein
MNSVVDGRVRSRALSRGLPLLQLIAAVVVIALLPGTMPNTFYLFSVTLGAIYLIAVLGLDLAAAAGAVSMGTAAFLLVGAYSVALMQKHGDWNPVIGMIVAAAVCAAAGAITSIPALRLGAFAIAVVTLMYADVVSSLALHFRSFTGGGDGLNVDAADIPLSRMWMYAALVGLGAYILHRNLLRGPFGRALMITRRGEAVAASLAVATGKHKVAAFTIYATFAGIAGGLYQQLNGPIGVDTFGIDTSITLLLMVVLGGVGSVTGPLLGTTVLTVIPIILNQAAGSGGKTKDLVYGAILLGVVLLVPRGLAGLFRGIAEFVHPRLPARWRAQPAEIPTAPTETAPILETQQDAGYAPVDPRALAELLAAGRGGQGERLEVGDIVRTIGGMQILRGVSMTVEPGHIVGLIGPNGSGKTTLLNSINGLSPVQGGHVRLGSAAIDGPARTRARAGIGRTFQTAVLAEEATVEANLMTGLDTERRASHLSYALRLPPALREAREHRGAAARWASALGLGRRLHAEASALTPRERRLLEIGRALATRPRVLLLDEPVAGLTGGEIDELVEIIQQVRTAGISTILVEHHAELVMSLCDQVVVLDAGECIAAGEPATVSRDPRVIAAYLGDVLTPHEGAAASPVAESQPAPTSGSTS